MDVAGGSSFADRCYRAVMQVPRGRVTTYKLLARAAGFPKAWRSVGTAMARNTRPMIIPCHRVVCSNGLLGGHRFGLHAKIAILKNEGVFVVGKRVADFASKVFVPSLLF